MLEEANNVAMGCVTASTLLSDCCAILGDLGG